MAENKFTVAAFNKDMSFKGQLAKVTRGIKAMRPRTPEDLGIMLVEHVGTLVSIIFPPAVLYISIAQVVFLFFLNLKKMFDNVGGVKNAKHIPKEQWCE